MRNVKKVLAIFLAVLFVLPGLGVGLTASAEGAVMFTVVPNVTTAHPGDTITYSVYMDPVTDLDGLQLTLGLPDGLTFGQADTNTNLLKAMAATCPEFSINFSESTLTLLIYTMSTSEHFTSTENGVLLTFTCTVDDDASGEKTIDLPKHIITNRTIGGTVPTEYDSTDSVVTVKPAAPIKTINLVSGKAETIKGAQESSVWFGNYKQSSDGAGGFNVDPIKWRVLSNADGKLFLLSDQNLDAGVYYERYFTVTWETSTIRAWLNGTGEFSEENFKDSAFSAGEDAAVCVTDVSNPDSVFDDRTVPGGNDTADKVFLLSRDEAMNTAYGFTNDIEPTDTRISINTAYTGSGGSNYGWTGEGGSADYWWLRSPGSADDRAAVIFETGQLNTGGYDVTNRAIAVRPAVNVDLSNVFFVCAAEGGKAGDGLTAVDNYDGSDWKLTFLDDSRNFAVSTTALVAMCADTVTLDYTGATVGENEYISAILTDENGELLYYGRIAQPTAADGTAEFEIPARIAEGTYTLKVFSEQYNGDKKTGYASPFAADVTLTVMPSPFTGAGTEDVPYEIGSDEDWQKLAQYVADGVSTAGKFFLQTADVTASVPVGSAAQPFAGTYDGGGKTLTAALDDASVMCLAPFSYISGATIENLRVDGTVSGGQHCAGLVGGINGEANLIRNCVVSAAITAKSDYSAGIVGHGGSSETTIEGCVFTGSITGGTHAGAFWGRSETEAKVTIRNCLENAAEYTTANVNPVGMGFYSEQSITAVGYRTAQRGTPNRNWNGAGTQLYAINRGENVTLTFGEATTFYDVSGLGVYDSGLMLCGSDAFAPANSTVALTAAYTGIVPEGYDAGFSPSAGTLTDGTLTMPAQDVTISAKIVCNPKTIRLMTNDAADSVTGAQTSNVWFGNYMQSSGDYKDPVKWRVLSNADGKLFLLADQNLDVVPYNKEEATDITWEECTLRKWLNGYDGNPYSSNFIGNAFSAAELAAVADSDLANANNPDYGTSGGRNTTDKVFLLSIADASNTAYGFTADYNAANTRISTNTAFAAYGGSEGGVMDGVGVADWWWLRSPGHTAYNAAHIKKDGSLYSYGYNVHVIYVAVRPALNVDLGKVLFTSPAEGGKQSDGLTLVRDYNGSDWKMTLLDESRSGFSAYCALKKGSVYTIRYNGATTGANEKISAMIVNADGFVMYYGALCDAEAGDNSVTIDVRGKLRDGDKLYVFNEQTNGDKKTDYASALIDVTQDLSQQSLIADQASLKTGFNTSDAKTVWYAGNKWRMIGFDGEGAASAAGTISLLSAGSMGECRFNESGVDGHQYSSNNCTLKKNLSNIFSNTFSEAERTAVTRRTLNAGGYDGSNTDCISGSTINSVPVWALSTKEANALDSALRVYGSQSGWWLRSPGKTSAQQPYVAAYVDKSGVVQDEGYTIRAFYDVRPAFQVDLEYVLFASAAVGGKRGDGALAPVEGYPGNEWKLTVYDGDFYRFRLTETEAAAHAGETVTLHYKSAVTGENKYISAILTDESGTPVYYGRIMQPTDKDGTFEITIPADLPGGSYTLKVFNEQYNGDQKTDSASKFSDVALTVYYGDGKALQMTDDGTAANIAGAQKSNVWFGNYRQSDDGKGGYNVDPIKWRVLENKDGKLFLLADQNLDVFEYNKKRTSVTWETCDMRSWLNGYGASANSGGNDYTGDSFKADAFTAAEFAAVADSELTNANNPDHGTSGGKNTTDKVFLLSIAEATNTAYGFTDYYDATNNYSATDTRVATDTAYTAGGGKISSAGMSDVGDDDLWWLRSPGVNDRSAAYVGIPGSLISFGEVAYADNIAVRPAVNVYLGKVLFTSAAVGGKTGDGLTAIPDYDGSDWKLTLLDSSRIFTVSSAALTAAPGETVSLTYSGATVGENEYISAIVTDETGAMLCYGRLAQPTAESGTVECRIPLDFAAGTYTLRVFSEQYNGDYQTDYASAPVDVTLTVGGETVYAAGDIVEYGSYPQSKVKDQQTLNALNALTLDWQSYDYYIGTGSSGAGNMDGTMTASDYTQYADAEYGGAKYRAVRFDQYRPAGTSQVSGENSSSQDNHGYEVNNTYWFKYEPLQWRVLDPETGLVLCETVIDSQPIHSYILQFGQDEYGDPAYWGDPEQNYYMNNYAQSDLRAWLNADFAQTAFTAQQLEDVKKTKLDNSAWDESVSAYDSAETTDKIYLLSWSDATNAAYGFNTITNTADPARQTYGSDYAKCQGLTLSGAAWYLRTPGKRSYCACVVYPNGYVTQSEYAFTTSIGVRPAMRLSTVAAQKTVAPDMTVSADNVTFGTVAEVTVTLPADATGTVDVTLAGENVTYTFDNVELTGGKATVGGKLEDDTYAVTASYSGDEKYESATAETTFTVSKLDPQMTLDAEGVMYGEDCDVTVTLAENATGTVSFKLTGHLEQNTYTFDNVAVVNGKAELHEKLNADDGYETVVTYSGDSQYAGAEGKITFVVGKLPTELEITTSPDMLAYGDTLHITVTLSGGTVFAADQIDEQTGEPAHGPGSVTISVDGKAFRTISTDPDDVTIVLDGNVATLEVNGLTAGQHNIEAVFVGDGNYKPSAADAMVDIGMAIPDMTIAFDPLELYVGETVTVTATLYGGAKFAEQTSGDGATCYLNGSFFDSASSGTDTVTFTISAPPRGTNTVKIVFNGDANYAAFEREVMFFVSMYDPQLSVSAEGSTCDKEAVITATLADDATGTVTFTLKDSNNYFLLDSVPVSDGKAEIRTMLNADDYKVTAEYSGDSRYDFTFAETTFSIGKIEAHIDVSAEDVAYGQNAQVLITMRNDTTGTVDVTLAGKRQTITFYDVELTHGKASVGGMLPADEYTVTVSYGGDDKYAEATAETTFEVSKATPELTLTVEQSTTRNKLTITVTKPVDATSDVKIQIDIPGADPYSETFNNDAFENGVLVLVYDGSMQASEDSCLATASYDPSAAGDENYNSSDTYVIFYIDHVHVWKEPTWDWTQDVNNPTYETSCTADDEGFMTGTVPSTAGERVDASTESDAYTPYTATVTIGDQEFTGTYKAYEEGTMLELCKEAFNMYKDALIAEAKDKKQDGDSDEAAALIENTKRAIEAVTYDERKPFDTNMEALDEAANLDQLDKDLADQRAADAVKDKIDAIGDVELTDECKDKIDDAREAYDALTDEQKDLVDNADDLTAAEEEYKALKDKADFEDYKDELIRQLEDKRQDDDSDETSKRIDDAIDAINDVEYDETKPLQDNKDALDDAVDFDQLDKDLADQRAADAVKDKIDAIGDVELTDECKDKIDDAREAYDALTDAQKDLVDNADDLTAAEEEYKALKDKADFEDYKDELIRQLEDKRQDDDSDETSKLIDDAIDAINDVEYDETKPLEDNKDALDDAVDLDQLDADLAEHRAIHYAEFYADGTLVESVPYTIDTKSITEPAVPEKVGHTGTWPSYTLKAGGTRIDAVYETIPYEATFYADGVLVDTVTYTVETTSIKDQEPAVPEKVGHTGIWPDYTLKVGGTRIDAVYTPNPQTVNFDPNGGEGEMESVTTAWGSKVTLPECTFTAPNGKEFDKWDAGDPGDEIEVKSDLTVKAVWKEKPLTLTADVDPAQTGERIKITVPYAKRGGIAATLTASEEGVRYESSKPGVISVDENGVIRLEKLCLFYKTATITAYSADGQKVASCVVNVRHAWWQYIIWFFFGSFWF